MIGGGCEVKVRNWGQITDYTARQKHLRAGKFRESHNIHENFMHTKICSSTVQYCLVERSCGQPPFVQNAAIQGGGNQFQYQPGTRLTYTCDTCYFGGTTTVTCTQNGSWNPQRPQLFCRRMYTNQYH